MLTMGPLGDHAFLARFASEDEAADWAAAVRSQDWPGIEDVVLAYQTAAVYADPERIDLDDLDAQLRAVKADRRAGNRPGGRLIRLPVFYDGPDLAQVARQLSLSESDVIAHH